MIVMISNIGQDIFMEEAKCYFQDKLNCKLNIADNLLLGTIDDSIVRDYTQDKMAEDSKKWLKEVFDNEYNWSD